jgi:glycine betaine catabolism B
MTDSLRAWARDLSSYGPMIWTRTLGARLGRGADYSSPQYRELSRRAVEQLHPRRMRLRVTDIIEETPTAKTLVLQRLDGPLPPFRAGQYVNLFIKVGEVWTSRPYSMTSPPGAPRLQITVREVEAGFVSTALCRSVEIGDELESTGPAGHFYYEPLIDGRELVFIAGGSGITPFISMLRHREGPAHEAAQITLIYGCRSSSDVIFRDELDRLARTLPGFRWELVISEPTSSDNGRRGFIDGDLLRTLIDATERKMYSICGPKPMYDSVLAGLTALGVPRHKIRMETFGTPRDITREPGWPEGLEGGEIFTIDVEGHGRIEAAAGETLMCSLERNGIVVPAQCRSGQCAACQTEVLSGRFYMLPTSWVRASSPSHSTIHACVTYPVEDMIIRVGRVSSA